VIFIWWLIFHFGRGLAEAPVRYTPVVERAAQPPTLAKQIERGRKFERGDASDGRQDVLRHMTGGGMDEFVAGNDQMHGFEKLALVADRPSVDGMLDFGFHLFVGDFFVLFLFCLLVLG